MLGWVLGAERVLAVVILALLKVPSYCCWRSFRLSVRDGPRRDGSTLVLHPLLHKGTELYRLLSIQGNVVEVILEARVVNIGAKEVHRQRGLLLRLGHRGHGGVEWLVVGHVELNFVTALTIRVLRRIIVTHAEGRGVQEVVSTVLPVEGVLEVHFGYSVRVADHREARGRLVVDLLLRGRFFFALCL